MADIIYHNDFLKSIINKEYTDQFIIHELPKLQQAAEVHGYRGPSKKKHNGIVPIRPTDKGLFKTLNKLVKLYNLDYSNSYVCPIKVVAHVPSGNRLVGYKINNENRIIILGVANYDD